MCCDVGDIKEVLLERGFLSVRFNAVSHLPGKSARSVFLGGCFVVHSSEGLFWDGQNWTADSDKALRFRGPHDRSQGYADPWLSCKQLADELRLKFGVACDPSYIAGAEVARTQIPRTQAGQRSTAAAARQDAAITGTAASQI